MASGPLRHEGKKDRHPKKTGDDASPAAVDPKRNARELAGDGNAKQSHTLSGEPDVSSAGRSAPSKYLTTSVDPARSAQMALVRAKDTKPEMMVRRLVHSLGYRFRVHRRDLPGVPDLVFPARRKVIFVHGCFWHQHGDPTCWRSRIPKTRREFWGPKLKANVARDASVRKALRELGWDLLVIWECQLGVRNRAALTRQIADFLGPCGN